MNTTTLYIIGDQDGIRAITTVDQNDDDHYTPVLKAIEKSIPDVKTSPIILNEIDIEVHYDIPVRAADDIKEAFYLMCILKSLEGDLEDKIHKELHDPITDYTVLMTAHLLKIPERIQRLENAIDVLLDTKRDEDIGWQVNACILDIVIQAAHEYINTVKSIIVEQGQ